MKKYKVLVTYVEAGMGHIISAEAIAQALETYYPDEVEVERCNLFTETNDKLMKRHEKFLVNMVKHSNRHPYQFTFLMFLQKHFTTVRVLQIMYNILFRREKKRGIAILKSYKPDAVVNTHFTPVHFSIEANFPIYGGDFLSILYVPDPNVHNWWDKRSDLLIVNNEEGYREAVEDVGFLPERTMLSRFVVRNEVKNCTHDKRELRRRHGLPEDQFTVIMASGAYAEGHLSRFAERFLELDKKFTLIIIAGKNEEVYDEFTKKIGNTGNCDLYVYRFRPDVHELYGASDLFVTKAGPNAILDSVYMGTPVMTNFYASPIERITRDLYVTKYGVGVHIDDAREAAKCLATYIDDPQKLAPYIQACHTFVENCVGGERQMADGIVELLRKREAEKAERAAQNTSKKKKKKSK